MNEGSTIGLNKSSFLLLLLNLCNIVISFYPTLVYDTVRGKIWYKLIKINERIEYLLLIVVFLFCSFESKQQILESVFKMCLIGIVLSSFRKMNKSDKIRNPKFVTKIANLWYLYLFIFFIKFFNIIEIIISG
jgi:hypothetical protein